jgi:hypothetical protein
MLKWLVVFVVFMLSFHIANGQSSPRRDSITQCFMFAGDYALYSPGGDLADRMGLHSGAGLSIHYKSRNAWLFSANWKYLFGDQLRERGVLDSISTSNGFVIDKEGKMADIRMYPRGFNLYFSVGRIFTNILSPNPNSGPFISAGAGYMQHKIRIYDNGGRTPQLQGDYLKGYDRLTSGLMINQFVGFWFMSKSRFTNFYAGFEFNQAFTKSRRSWNYDLMQADTSQRIELQYGFRVGWNILLNRTGNQQYYMY